MCCNSKTCMMAGDCGRCPRKQYPRFTLTDRQARQLLVATKTNLELHLGIALALHCGLRLGEIARLRWADVDLVEDFLNVAGRKAFVNSRVRFLLNARWQRREHGEEGVLGSNSRIIMRNFRSKVREISLSTLRHEVTFHDLRQKFAHDLCDFFPGMSAPAVLRLGGWRSMTSTNHYCKVGNGTSAERSRDE